MTKGKTHKARRSSRSPVTPFEARGSLIADDGSQSDTVLIWNISDTGLCVWVTEKFRQGDEMTLHMTHPKALTIRCVARWVRTIPDRSGFLLGLEAITSQEALAKLYHSIASNRAREAG